MTKLHLHLFNPENDQWIPGTTSSVGSGLGGGAGRATADGWSYAAANGGITDTSDVTLQAAAAGQVHYLSSLQLYNSDGSVSTEVVIKDGSTVLWRMMLKTGQLEPVNFTFAEPLRTSVNTAMTAACITTSSETYINAQGYTVQDVQETERELNPLADSSIIELLDYRGDPVADSSGAQIYVGSA